MDGIALRKDSFLRTKTSIPVQSGFVQRVTRLLALARVPLIPVYQLSWLEALPNSELHRPSRGIA